MKWVICSQNRHCNDDVVEEIEEAEVDSSQNDEEAFVNRPKDPFQQKYRK